MVTVDKLGLSDNKRNLPYRKGLEDFLERVALIKPLCTFAVDNECLRNEWVRHVDGNSEYEETINRIKVYEDGEAIGSISTETRYRGSVGREDVFGVESFRIHKERGNRNTTYAKDLKVALRNAKKTLIGRLDGEVVELIKNKLNHYMSSLMHTTMNEVTWTLDTRTVAFAYAMKAYEANKEGKTIVEMPVTIPTVASNDKLFDRCSAVEQTNILNDHYIGKNGYGVMVRHDGSIVVYSYASDKLSKYPGFSELPTNIQEKLAMFKVLDANEAYANFGVKFEDGFFYIP